MSKLVDTFYNRPDAGTCATLQEAKTKSTEGRRKEAATHPNSQRSEQLFRLCRREPANVERIFLDRTKGS